MTIRPRVLSADDNPGVLKAIGRLLARDYDVVAMVSDGAAAIDATVRFQPDVVGMDIGMPVIGGLEACRLIRQSSPGVSVILVSEADRDVIQGIALAAGAVRVITKHEVPDLLSAAISDTLRR